MKTLKLLRLVAALLVILMPTPSGAVGCDINKWSFRFDSAYPLRYLEIKKTTATVVTFGANLNTECGTQYAGATGMRVTDWPSLEYIQKIMYDANAIVKTGWFIDVAYCTSPWTLPCQATGTHFFKCPTSTGAAPNRLWSCTDPYGDVYSLPEGLANMRMNLFVGVGLPISWLGCANLDGVGQTADRCYFQAEAAGTLSRKAPCQRSSAMNGGAWTRN